MASPARKVVCTFACGPQTELLALAREPLEDFARRHGYDLVVEDGPRAPERAPSWSKIPLLRDLLERYELAVWVDADAIFVDTSRDIAEELEDNRFLYLAQHRYGSQDAANCGVLMVRSSPEALRFLDDVWARTEYLDHPWWEQAAILTMLGYRIEQRLDPFVRLAAPTALFTRAKLLTHEWNSIRQDPAPRPLLEHYPGLRHEDRLALMSADLAEFRRRRAAEALPAPFAVSLVLPLALIGTTAWETIERIASLPDALPYEAVVVDDGSARFASILAALDGDVTVVSGSTLARGLDAAVAAARGRMLVVLDAPPPPAEDWLDELLAAAERFDVSSAVRARAEGAVAVPTAWAIRRSDYVAWGGCGAFAPAAATVGEIFSALHGAAKRPFVAAIDRPRALAPAA